MRNQSFILIGILACSLASCNGDDDDDATGGTSSRSGGAAGQVNGGRGGAASGGAGGAVTKGGATGTSGSVGEGGSGGALAQLGDPEIMKVLDTANTGEIEQGELALTRAQDKSVQDFAQLMVDAHTAGKEKGQSVAQAEMITPQPNPVSEELESESAAILVALRATPASEFDRTYMESQVQVHTAVLALLDEHLIPSAENAAVRALLVSTRADVLHHFEMAQTIVESFD